MNWIGLNERTKENTTIRSRVNMNVDSTSLRNNYMKSMKIGPNTLHL